MHACATCGSPLAAAQRFCLECGTRAGATLREAFELEAGAPPPTLAPVPAAGPRLTASWIPTPRAAALAIMVMLGFGVIVGGAAGPDISDSLASQRASSITVELPPAAAAAAPAAAVSDDESLDDSGDEASTDPPAAAPEPVESAPVDDEPAATAPTTTTPADDGSDDQSTTAPVEPAKAPPIKHVWVVWLADQPYAKTFGDALAMPNLAALAKQGLLLSGFHSSGPTTADAGSELLGGKRCPAPTPTAPLCVQGPEDYALTDQLTGNGLDWRGYLDAQQTTAFDCQHTVADPRNPFLLFQTVRATPECPTNLVGLDKLAEDTRHAKTAPAFSLILPGPCHDGVDVPCLDGAPAGPVAADTWLKGVTDTIVHSRAFKDNGLLVVTTDHAVGDATACCTDKEPSGGVTGALLVSKYVAAGQQLGRPFSTVSLLHGIEDVFGLRYLADADTDVNKDLPVFDTGVWTNWSQDVDESDTGS